MILSVSLHKNYFCFVYSILLLSLLNDRVIAQGNKIEPPDQKKIGELMFKKHPDWAANAVIYEVNLRQYGKSDNFKSFEKELDRLKNTGIDVLWFMPVHPIGQKERKGSLGSYYAVQDYEKVNPEFGTLDDFINLVKVCHEKNLKVIIDWVANHTAADSKWSLTNPEFFNKDSTGKFMPPVADWSDVIDLNYDNKEMRKAMINSMKFWLTETGIDGFRCDVAEMVPLDFWIECTRELKTVKPDIFMLAEGEKPELHLSFDMTYTWSLFGEMRKLAKGEKDVNVITDYIRNQSKQYKPDALRMYFTTNHDENSWNGTEQEMFGQGTKAFYVLCATLNGMPLLYSGQEASLNKRLKFFDKDPIDWSDLGEEEFYKTIFKLKHENKALLAGSKGGSLTLVPNSQPASVLSFTRKNGDAEILVVINFSAKNQNIVLPSYDFTYSFKELFTGSILSKGFKGDINLKPWEFRVYVK